MDAGHRAFGKRIKVGLINHAPTEESNSYIGRIKTVQFIDIFKKVGLMNQAPTEEQIPAIMLFCYFWQEGAEADQYFVR